MCVVSAVVLSLVALHPAHVSPRHESRAYRSPLFSRRSAVLAPLATLLALPLSAVPASARSYKGDDPLTLRLRQSREELAACGPLLEQRRWEEVRKVTSVLLAAMTFKGYTGESVKSRAAAWAAAGDAARSSSLLSKRTALMRRISALENGVYAAQTNKKELMVTAEQLQAELTGAVSELDALLPEMGSDAHRRSLAAPLHLSFRPEPVRRS